MNLSAARRLDRWIGIPACALLSLIHRFGRRKSERRIKPRSILVIQISEMGSVLLAYPMLSELERRYPGTEFDFLVFGKNRDMLELLGLNSPYRVIPLEDRSLSSFLVSAAKALKHLRRRGFDTVIDLELFSRVSAIFAAACGAKLRAGFHRYRQEGLYRGSFWTHPVLYNPYLHMTRNFTNLLDALEAGTGRPLVKSGVCQAALVLPRITPDETRRRWAVRLLEESCPQRPPGAKTVLFNPGAGDLPIRAWPLEHYRELARLLLRRPQISVGVIGLEKDRHFFSELASTIQSDRLFELTGKTPHVLDLIAVFDACQVLVTADGGPAHFAALSSIHSVIFFGPETPVLYRPLGDNHTCLYAGIPCSPCLTAYNHRQTPCDGDNVCVRQFLPAQVEQIVLSQLGIKA